MEIKDLFDQFISALEENKTESFDKLMCEDVDILTSNFGKINGLDEAKEKMRWKGGRIDYKKLRIFNLLFREKDDFAVSSCYLLPLLAREENNFMNIFTCAFLLVIEYEKKDDWKIKKIRANMTYEYGNTLLVSEHWQMMDYAVYTGSKLAVIDGVKNNPWNLVKETSVKLSDEDLIKQAFAHYAWAIDTDAFDFEGFSVEDMEMERTGEKGRNIWRDSLNVKRHRNMTIFSKEHPEGLTIPREVCWNHIIMFEDLKIEGDKAHGYIRRIEPNRLGNKFLNKYNIDMFYDFYRWSIDFVKQNDGNWYISKFCNDKVELLEDFNVDNRRYF